LASRHIEKQYSTTYTVVDLVAEKPVTFSSIHAILKWFQEKINESVGTEG